MAGGKKILITSYLNKNVTKDFVPDIIILTGSKPEIERDLTLERPPRIIVITSEPTNSFRISKQGVLSRTDTIHYARKSGAFVKSI